MDDNQDIQYDEGSLSGDIAAAFDAAEAEPATQEDTPHVEPADTTAPDADGAGQSADTGASAAEQPAADDSGAAGAKDGEAAQVPDESPPVSLPPAAREAWKDTPKAVREAVALREKQYNDGIVKYANDAKRAQQMDGVLGQYQHYFAMTGEPVGKTVNDLLRVASNLHMAPGATKAQIVAGLINQYSVPIDVLDSLLAGESPQAPQTDVIDQRIQQAVQPFQQVLTEMQQQRMAEQQRQQGQVATEIQQFAAKHEFYNDVASDMADFLDIAAKNGRQMTLDDAYQRACALNPQISQILQARSAAPTASQQRAASTLRGNGRGGDGAAAEPDSLHAAISAAWDSVGRMG